MNHKGVAAPEQICDYLAEGEASVYAMRVHIGLTTWAARVAIQRLKDRGFIRYTGRMERTGIGNNQWTRIFELVKPFDYEAFKAPDRATYEYVPPDHTDASGLTELFRQMKTG